MAMRRAISLVLVMGVMPALTSAADIPDRRPAPAATPVPAPAANPSRETLVDLLLQMEQLQAELRSLRGQVETQTYELDRLKNRQRDLLSDLDRRLRELERRGGVAAAAGADGTAATGSAGRTPDSPAADAASTAPVSAAEQQAYDAAFALMKQGQYSKAIQAFRGFIGKYPRSQLTDNSQYWIGEALYVGRNFTTARSEFSKVLSDYPGSDKAADAALKVGFCHYELSEWSKAREALTKVVAKYPNTRTAKSAEERLAKMKKERR
jgi:tol-pal system protein YbgF